MATGSFPSDALSKITGTVRDHEVSFVNGIVVVVTLSGEEVFRKVAFLCPCTKPSSEVYGASFIWGPATVLFTLGIVINNVTWRLLHGCCYRSSSTSHGLKKTCSVCLTIITRSLVAPSAWLFISFLDGSYYMCMVSTSPCVPIANSTENRQLVAESQVIAWTFLVAIVLVVMCVLVGTRCIDKFTYVQSKYIEAYQELEQMKFDEEMRDRARQLADVNVREFFNKDIRMKSDWDAISVAPSCDVQWVERSCVKSNRFHRFKGNFPEPFFTPLHKWANKERRIRPISDDEQLKILNLQMSPIPTTPGSENFFPPSPTMTTAFTHNSAVESQLQGFERARWGQEHDADIL